MPAQTPQLCSSLRAAKPSAQPCVFQTGSGHHQARTGVQHSFRQLPAHAGAVGMCCCRGAVHGAMLTPALLTEGAGHAGKQYPVTINEMLLRGCTLKNSKSIIGAVVYTGDESRIQKNSAKTPHKIGALLFGLFELFGLFGEWSGFSWCRPPLALWCGPDGCLPAACLPSGQLPACAS